MIISCTTSFSYPQFFRSSLSPILVFLPPDRYRGDRYHITHDTKQTADMEQKKKEQHIKIIIYIDEGKEENDNCTPQDITSPPAHLLFSEGYSLSLSLPLFSHLKTSHDLIYFYDHWTRGFIIPFSLHVSSWSCLFFITIRPSSLFLPSSLQHLTLCNFPVMF